ncbi:uncharacterized protein LOC128283945 [Gossypium arboreum]|uniref:uncharacterized protein LOC128283945 n=1 Tax=Gossypium arboreum TaxID=29729 RepID=UPI0022F1BEE5|nr:uncharacterized protein LOC128283945 [Gossypium arboreum]
METAHPPKVGLPHLGAEVRLGLVTAWAEDKEHRAEVPDLGSTHSYVVSAVSETLGLSFESTYSEITAVILLRQFVGVNKLFRDIALRIKEDIEVIVIRERRDYLTNVISALVVEKLVRKGYEAYLAYISVADSENSSVKDIRTVRDFPDVFPEELPGLPPNRKVEDGATANFGINSDGVLCFRGQIYVPNDEDLRLSILREAHSSPYAMYLDGNKIYRDLRELYWWPGLKREVTDFVARCLTCQQTAHFIPVRTDFSLQKLAKLYISEVVRLHGVSVSIISDRDPRFTSRF